MTVGGTTTGGTTVTYQGVSMMIGGTTTGGTTTTMDLDSELYRVEGNRTDMVTVVAVPDADYEVLGWLNTALEPVYFASKFTAPLAFFEQAGEMFPYFQYAKARITVQDTDKATVAVTVGGVNQTVGEEISADPDAVVTLSLTNIDSAYTFDGWVDGNGVIQSTNTTWTTDMTVLTGYTETTHEQSGITVTERSQTNYSIAPSFTWTKATLTLIPGNNGSMTAGVTGSTPTAISAQTTVTELKTASYTLTALESDSNYVFVGWYDGSGNLISSNMTLTDAFSNLVDYGSITPRFQSAMVTMKVTASANGTTTFDGAAVSGTQTKTLDSRQIYTLAATPADGYVFNGWLDQNNNCLSSSATWSTAPVMGENGAVITVHASFIATSGLAVWQVTDTNGATYTDLSDAVATGAKKIILHTDGTLPAGDYTIPSGVTLLIPYNSDYTSYTSANFVSATTGASAFRTLTMSSGSNLFVNGTLELGGQLSDNGQFNGSCGKPVGPDGRINMASGSKITVNNGGKLYAWGYIYGNGEVIAKSGASIDEAFQMKNYRGGTITSQIYNKVFPFNQYYVQNIEVPLTFEAGAREYVSSAVNVTLAGQQKCNFMFIGGSSDTCLFKLQSGATLRKDYIESTDRLEFKLNGNASMDAVSITIKVTVNTNNYPLPLTSNMSVDIESGTTTINQAISLLPGAEIYVREGATVSIASGKGVYVYDRDEWINNNEQSYVAQDGTKHLYQVAYTASKNEAPGIRNESSLVDAKLQIDGVLNVGVSSSSKGYLYTSASGGNITSSGTGRINFVVAPTAGSLPECNMSGSVVSVNFSAPKLHNGDDSYTTTAGSSAGTTYYYCATHDKWETSHDITYHSNLTVDNTATQSIVGGSSSLKDFAGLSVDWAKTGYSFASWNTAANGSGDTYAVGDSVNFNSEAVPADLYAQWEANTYTLTLNPNGGTVDPNSGSITYDATYGDAFNENGAETGTLPTPVRTSGSTSYRFDGWFTQATGGTRVESTDTVQVTADTTLFAHWSVMYNVSFVSNGGSAVEPQQVAYNGFVTKPEAPTKSGNTFDGWYSDAELTNEFDFGTRITSSTELYAKWTAHNAIVTITYDLGLNASNPSTTLTYHYGDTLDAPTYIYYDFSSWSYSDKSDLSTTDMKSELDTLLLNSTNQAVSVTAVFTRQQYEIQLWGNANGSAAAISGWSRNKAVGKSIRVSAPSTYGNPAHSFSYWEIQKDLNGNGEFTNVKTIDTISTQKATICITEPGTYRAIAYFGVAEQGSKINLRIVNRFAEKYGDSKRVGVTMEISMPETGYTIQEIGFLSSPDTKYYTSSTYRNESGYNPEVIPGAHSENADLLRIKNGSYTRRFTTFDNDPSTTDYDNYYVVGYLIYKIDGSDDCHYLYCTYSVGKTDTIAANTMDFFDTLNYDALLSPAP